MLRRGRLHLVAALAALAVSCGPRGPRRQADSDADPAPTSSLYAIDAKLAQADLAGAEVEARALAAAWPRSTRAQRSLQDVLRRQMSPRDWRLHYEDAVRERPADPLAWYLAARTRIDEPDTARESFDRALELDPSAVWPVVGLAYLAQNEGDLFAAVETYKDALGRSPRSRTLRLMLGILYVDLQLHVDAQRHLEAALALAPEDAEVKIALARAHLGLSRDAAALELLEGVRLSEPRAAGLYAPLALCYLRLGRAAEAQAAYREGLERGAPRDEGLATELRIAVITEGGPP